MAQRTMICFLLCTILSRSFRFVVYSLPDVVCSLDIFCNFQAIFLYFLYLKLARSLYLLQYPVRNLNHLRDVVSFWWMEVYNSNRIFAYFTVVIFFVLELTSARVLFVLHLIWSFCYRPQTDSHMYLVYLYSGDRNKLNYRTGWYI